MKQKFRIYEEELLDKEHFPVKAVFNMVADSRFVRSIEGISRGIGFGENYGACVFWDDLDDYDRQYTQKYEGVEFGLNDGQETIVSYQDLYYYLTLMCNRYCTEFSQDTTLVAELLKRYQARYLLR